MWFFASCRKPGQSKYVTDVVCGSGPRQAPSLRDPFFQGLAMPKMDGDGGNWQLTTGATGRSARYFKNTTSLEVLTP